MIKLFESEIYPYLAISDVQVIWFNDLMDCNHVIEDISNENYKKVRYPYMTSYDEHGNIIRKEMKITSTLNNKIIIDMISYLNDCPKNSFKYMKKFKTITDFEMYLAKLKVTKELEL